MPKSRSSVLAALAMNDSLNVLESISHVAAVKLTKGPTSKLTLITGKTHPGADSTSNMSDASSTCSPIDNSSMDSLNSVAEACARSGRGDDRNDDGPRTRSSSRRRSLESKKRASQKKNKKRREREAAAKRKLLGTAMSDTSPSELPSPTSPTSPSDMSDHSTSVSTAELDMDRDKEDDEDIEEREQEQVKEQEQGQEQEKEEKAPLDDKDKHEEDNPTIDSEPSPSIQPETHSQVLETDKFDTPVELEDIPEEQQEPEETIAEAEPEIMEKDITVEEININTTENEQVAEEAMSVMEETKSQEHPQPASSQDISNESISNLPSWDVASETVATVAIQCLTRDKDMELSYVAILSAVTVLQRDKSASQPSTEEARERVAGLYDQLFSIMCGDVFDSLDKETARQGAMAPDALYTLLYNAVLQAGYQLQLETHLLIAKYLIHHKKTEEARGCIARIDEGQWTGPVYRAAIVCFLSAKPRQLQEAESVLENYIDYQERSTNQQNIDQATRNWFKLQLDASKWEDIKIQYERRRARLVDAPGNIDRFAQSEENKTKSSQEQQRSPQRQFKHERSASAASPVASPSPSHHRSPSAQLSSPSGHQRTLSGHQCTPSVAMPSWPSGASATLNASPTPAPVAKGPFSFLSSLKFTAKDTNTIKSDTSALPSRIHSNRHLTVLDNGMLEDCIRHKEFEYGWKHIYERMGASLEDSETSRIVMRMCRQAFMGYSGTFQPGSSNMTKGVAFEHEIQEDISNEEKPRRRDPEIWEARAWAVYNKAMVNPHTFTASTQLTSTTNTTSSTALFFHDILTVAICSPETSSRFLKAFKVYSTLRSDPQNQQLLRDPFVMSCMIKAVYDAVIVVVNNPEQLPPASSFKRHHRRSSSLSLNRSQPMTLGPLMDLAFEIYADMRNVGSIRHLPSLINLAPVSPTGRHSRRNSALFGSPAPAAHPTPSVASSTSDDSEDKADSTSSDSPRPSFTAPTMLAFQDLNPNLKPNPQAKRLPTEVYLAILHLCIQLPVFRMSSQVVKTVLDDMESSSARQSAVNLDRHLGAALQQYHDAWICAEAENKSTCVYQRWMYKPETFIQEHCKVDNKDGDVQEATSEVPLEGLEDAGCNEQFYWDLWSAEDTQVKDVIFTQQRVEMLIKHIGTTLL